MLEVTMWENIFAFFIKFSFISLVSYGWIRGILVNVINNIYGGKLAIEQSKQIKKEST